MDVNLTQLLDWSSSNYMKVNVKKTKEMIISPSSCNVFNSSSVANVEIERVHVFKLLGVYINRSLKWDDHVRSIRNKAASRIYFLKQLNRSSVGPDDLYHFYATVIRPVLEYACPVWHSGLTVAHRNRIEAIQKRVFVSAYRYIAITTLAITAVFLEYLRQFLIDLHQTYRHSSVP